MTGPTLLSVDDSSDDVMLLSLACRAAKVSFQFQSVDNGENAIAYLQGSQTYADRAQFPLPDLILLDLKMPGKSGFDVLAWIRSQSNLQGMPVVVLTSSVHAKDRARALELGARQYLVKPVSYEGLQSLVEIIDRQLTSQGALDLGPLEKLDSQQQW
jgi:CheY-like chemotaxis protein